MLHGISSVPSNRRQQPKRSNTYLRGVVAPEDGTNNDGKKVL